MRSTLENLASLGSVLIAASVSFLTAYSLRFDFEVPQQWWSQALALVPVIAVAKAGIFYPFREYLSDWSHLRGRNLIALTVHGCICSTFAASSAFVPSFHIPKGVIAIDFLLTCLFLGAIAVGRTLLKERSSSLRLRTLSSGELIEAGGAKSKSDGDGSIPVSSPTLPEIEELFQTVSKSYRSGQITSGGIVKLFEEEVRRFTMVEHAVAVSSCTSGLMLAFAAMELAEGSEVIVPSFTFAATVHALVWNRLTPVYVDCLPGTMTIDPEEVLRAMSSKTAAIYPVTVFGLPPDLDPLQEISGKYGVPLICDSAQGLGSMYKGKPAGGAGLCEVFSFSPSKVVTAMEGGVITTNNSILAAKLRAMRDYGKGPDGEEMLFSGLSAWMIEFDAAVGLLSLRKADALIEARLRLMDMYSQRLRSLSGCTFQEFPSDRRSSGSHFVLLISPDAPVRRDGLAAALKAEKIQTKRYFYPPVHAHEAFRAKPHRIVGDLKSTWYCSLAALTLPLYSHMTEEQVDRVCHCIKQVMHVQEHRKRSTLSQA